MNHPKRKDTKIYLHYNLVYKINIIIFANRFSMS